MKKVGRPEKRKVSVGLLLSDFRTVYNVISEARRRGIEVLYVNSFSELPLNAKAIITSKKDDPKLPIPVLFVEDFPSYKALMDRAYEVAFGKDCPKFITVSIDPGEKRTGCAFFAEDILLRTSTYSDRQRLFNDIEEFFNTHQNCKKYVIIGEGAGNLSYDLEKDIRERFLGTDRVEIMTVSENSSSRRNVFISAHPSDESAALMLFVKVRGKLILSGR
ncbi:MAG: hypothetical protein RMJ14_04505 [Nitrososphaerota archaeon]|nr:hypothetical protein [Aigarchaeota archaeon]MDW8076879.1 hypothetical protein [Nitrososphaerota archaeon]